MNTNRPLYFIATLSDGEKRIVPARRAGDVWDWIQHDCGRRDIEAISDRGYRTPQAALQRAIRTF